MRKLLERVSLACWNSLLYRNILFFVATLFVVTFIGYHFGTFDQSIHIPFLKKMADPSLYPNDRFFDLRFSHFSYFWFLFIPFYRIGFLEISMFITHFIVTYLTLYGVWRLTKTLFNTPLTSFLSVVVFIFPHIGFNLLALIEFSLLNRTFVLPFLLFAIDSYLNRQYLKTYILLGIFYNFHVISVNFVLAMLFLDSLLRFREVGWKRIIANHLTCVIFALPVLVWKARVSPIDFSIHKEWFSLIDKGLLHHLFIEFSTDSKFLLVFIGGIGTLLMFYISFYFLRRTKLDRIINNFIIAGILILIANMIVSRWMPITIIVESQIARVSVFILLFGYLYFIHFLITKKQSLPIIFITIISGSPIIPPLIWYIYYRLKSIQVLKLVSILAFVSTAAFLIYAAKLGMWYPGIYIFAKKDADYDVQMWARNNTPKDTLFITPPTPWLFYDLEWRVISERSTITHLGELAEAAFSPEYISYWKPRFESLAPHAIEKFRGDVFENKNIVKIAFNNLSTEDFMHIARKYGASYLVVEKSYSYNFPQLYQNTAYKVYSLK